MGGGDSLYDKIDRGIRGCRVVVTCVTQKYSLSANCRREVSLADALKKPMIPLLLEQMKWPPDGPMSMVFTELLFINFYRDETIQMTWKGEKFDELLGKLSEAVPSVTGNSEKKDQNTGKSVKTSSDGNNKAVKQDTVGNNKDASLITPNDAKTKGRAGTTSSAVKRTPNRVQGTDGKEIRGKNQGNDLKSTETNTERDNSAIKPAPRNEPNNNKKENIASNSSLETAHSRAVQASTKGSPAGSKPIPRNRATSAKISGSDLKATDAHLKSSPGNNDTAANHLRDAFLNSTATLRQKNIKNASASHSEQSGERSTSNVRPEKTDANHTGTNSGKHNDTDAVQRHKNTSEHNNTSSLQSDTTALIPTSQSKQERDMNGQRNGNSETGKPTVKSTVAKQDDQNVYKHHSERVKTPIKSPVPQQQSKSCTIL